MGTALDKNSDAERADKCYQKALSIKRNVLDKDDLSIAKTLSNMGINSASRGAIDEGIDCFQEW